MKLRIALSVALSLSTISQAMAHYETESDRKAAAHAKSVAKDQLDPWSLLKAALSPALASSANVQISTDNTYRYIRSNGIPNHQTGQFPNRGNPNTIREQDYLLRVPLVGTDRQSATPLVRSPFGVAVNGVLFDPGTAEYWHNDPNSGWHIEAMYMGPRLGLDASNAHVQPNGAYHYHGLPTGLLEQFRNANKPVMLGWAADGFPIYASYSYSKSDDKGSSLTKMHSSYRLKKGSRPNEPQGPGGEYSGLYEQDFEYVPGSGELDECNGRFGVTPEYPKGTYYYVITDAYPFVPRMFHGTPDPSFRRRPPRGEQSQTNDRPGGQGFGGQRFGGPRGGPGLGGPTGGPGFGGPPNGPGFGSPPNGPGFGSPPNGPGFGGSTGGSEFGSPPGFGGPPDER